MLPGEPIVRDYGDFELRSQVAVNMTICSTKVHDETKLVAPIHQPPQRALLLCAACGYHS